MATVPGGAVVLADYHCRRLLTISAAGTTSVVDLRPRRGRRYPGAVLSGRDGTLWFTAVTLRGAHVQTVIGHVARDGTIRQFRAANARLGPRAFAQAARAAGVTVRRIRSLPQNRSGAPRCVSGHPRMDRARARVTVL